MQLARSTALLAALFVFLFAPSSSASHKDDRIGFSIETPRDWTTIPMKIDERWLVADYQSPKAFFYTEKGGWTVEHKPDMQIIAFVADQIKEIAKLKKRKDKDGKDIVLVDYTSPYKDYEDYMQRRYQGGGWFVDKKEEGKVGDVAVTQYEIRVEKLSYDGPKKIVTWIYHIEDVDLAVQFEVLRDSWPKLESEVKRCLKSFKTVERSGEALTREVSTGKKLNFVEVEALPPEERKNWRIAAERDAHERAAKDLPAGWQCKKFGRFLVVFHTDEKYAKRVADQAEAVWQWLEENFGFVGDKEYVRAPIIRICKDAAEEQQYYRAGDMGWNNVEIFTHQDNGGSMSWEMQWVNQRVMRFWFEERDRELFWAMPMWLSNGLSEVVGQARVKTGKVDFKTDHWNRDQVREAVRDGKVKKPRELMMQTNSELFSGDGGSFWGSLQQSQALVTFLATGPASRHSKTKSVLADYVKSLKAVQTAIKAEGDKGKPKDAKPTTEEEENKAFRDRQQGYKAAEKRILEETWKRTFAGWTDRDWATFEDVYFKAIS